jgi:hypothetical protein
MVENVAISTFTSSAVVVFLMQKLKASKWFPLVQEGRATLNRIISVLAAAASAVAIGWAWNPSARALTIQIPTVWGLMIALWHWLNHYALQETIYQATANRTIPKP